MVGQLAQVVESDFELTTSGVLRSTRRIRHPPLGLDHEFISRPFMNLGSNCLHNLTRDDFATMSWT